MSAEGEPPQPPRTWALLTTIGLLSRVVLEAGIIVLTYFATHVVPDWESRAERGDLVGGLLAIGLGVGGVLTVAASLFTCVAFLVWLYRAVRFAHARGLRPDSTPSGAVVCWFVPFVNLVRPYGVVRSLHRVSSRVDPSSGTDWVARWPGIFPVWWFAWLAMLVAARLASPSWFDENAALEVGWTDVAELVFATVAATCATGIVWSISRAQLAPAAEAPAAEFVPPAGSQERSRAEDEDDEEDEEDEEDED